MKRQKKKERSNVTSTKTARASLKFALSVKAAATSLQLCGRCLCGAALLQRAGDSPNVNAAAGLGSAVSMGIAAGCGKAFQSML